MRNPDLTRWTAGLALALLGIVPASTSAESALSLSKTVPHSKALAKWSLERHDVGITALPPAKMVPVDLAIDDGSREVDIGFNGAAAFQFLWFNRFDPPALGRDFALEQIQVLFPPDPEVSPGAAVQLVVFTDPDGDPTNGASFVAAIDDVVQFVDGVTFSVYTVDPPVTVSGSDHLLIGVVNRFVTSGVSPPSRPAALDTTTAAGGSWLAEWTGDPPNPPSLPSDNVLALVDTVEPGNWMIRAAGTPLNIVTIPALGGSGLAVLAVLLALVGAVFLRR